MCYMPQYTMWSQEPMRDSGRGGYGGGESGDLTVNLIRPRAGAATVHVQYFRLVPPIGKTVAGI